MTSIFIDKDISHKKVIVKYVDCHESSKRRCIFDYGFNVCHFGDKVFCIQFCVLEWRAGYKGRGMS